MRHLIAFAIAIALTGFSSTAFAGSCDIFNDTDYDFTVESGNVSNQQVNSHTHTSIASGKIKAKSDSGKGVGGSCQDGDDIKIVEDDGVLMIVPD